MIYSHGIVYNISKKLMPKRTSSWVQRHMLQVHLPKCNIPKQSAKVAPTALPGYRLARHKLIRRCHGPSRGCLNHSPSSRRFGQSQHKPRVMPCYRNSKRPSQETRATSLKSRLDEVSWVPWNHRSS